MADRVVLHVGVPKTGTTFLQQLLWANRERLRGAGVHLVVDSMRELFAAARDLRRGGTSDWRRLVDAVNATPGTVVLSCEGLSAVPAGPAAAALRDLRPAEITVVCTLRDPVRVLPSVWQQHVRTGSTVELPAFMAHVREGMAWEWLPDPLEVLDAWSPHGRPDAVRLVTVPRPPAAPILLWERFAEACGLPATLAAELPDVANSSLPGRQVELLRRVNASLGEHRPVDQPGYRELVRPLLSHPATGSRALTDPPPPAWAAETGPALEPADQRWAAEQASRLVETLGERRFSVVGDLDELVPGPPEAPVVRPAWSEADIAEAAVDVVADLLVRRRGRAATDGPPRGRRARQR